jgi:hypothetical protein
MIRAGNSITIHGWSFLSVIYLALVAHCPYIATQAFQ